MKIKEKKKITEYIENNIQTFHSRRIENLFNLKLTDILRRKNPYLFKAKNINTASDLVKLLLDAHLSSQEEGIFGEFLEHLAIFTSHSLFGGKKSTAEGIDLELEKNGIIYLVSIKSGPNWGNSQQIIRMKDNFKRAKKILRTNSPKIHIKAINGCCYGRDDHPDKGEYIKLCGQRFWEFISGDHRFFVDIIEPLGYKAKEKNDIFYENYANVINKFTSDFITDFCSRNGSVLWEKIVKLNSEMNKNKEIKF